MNNDEIIHVGRIAMMLGQVERGVHHPDGVTPETDTTHSVMTAYLACSLAARYYPHLDAGLVAQLAIVHDAVEVYAGDTFAVTRDEAGRREQDEREAAALQRISSELPGLGWLTAMITVYEAQELPEARFVHAVDKIAPKIAVVLSGVLTQERHGVTREILDAFLLREQREMDAYAADFPEICALRDELNEEVRRLTA